MKYCHGSRCTISHCQRYHKFWQRLTHNLNESLPLDHKPGYGCFFVGICISVELYVRIQKSICFCGFDDFFQRHFLRDCCVPFAGFSRSYSMWFFLIFVSFTVPSSSLCSVTTPSSFTFLSFRSLFPLTFPLTLFLLRFVIRNFPLRCFVFVLFSVYQW